MVAPDALSKVVGFLLQAPMGWWTKRPSDCEHPQLSMALAPERGAHAPEAMPCVGSTPMPRTTAGATSKTHMDQHVAAPKMNSQAIGCGTAKRVPIARSRRELNVEYQNFFRSECERVYRKKIRMYSEGLREICVRETGVDPNRF